MWLGNAHLETLYFTDKLFLIYSGSLNY
jgi:hypothetical protein